MFLYLEYALLKEYKHWLVIHISKNLFWYGNHIGLLSMRINVQII